MQVLGRSPLPKEKVTKNKKRKDFFIFLGIPYYILLVGLILLPVSLIFYYGFTYMERNMLHFTLQEFVKIFNTTTNITVIVSSIKYAIITTIVCLLVGYPTAYFITKTKPRTQGILILAITAPMWINMLLRIMAWRQLFESSGLVTKILMGIGFKNIDILGSDFAIVFGMVYTFLPFMIIPIFTVLNKIDYSLIEASNDLGGSKAYTFAKVTLPLSLSGIMSGVIMVLLPAATAIIVPMKLGNNKILIGSLIEEYVVKVDNIHFASSLAILLSIIIFALLYLSKLIERKYEEK